MEHEIELQDYQKSYLEPREGNSYDKNLPTVYLIEGSCGEYDMHHTYPVCVKKSLEDAQDFVRRHEMWKNWVEEYTLSKHYEDPSDMRYEQLQDDFHEYVWNTVAPGKESEDDLTTEEFERIEEMEMNEEHFEKFIVERGYSKEVAEATIAFHSDEFSEYNTTYSIYKINIE